MTGTKSGDKPSFMRATYTQEACITCLRAGDRNAFQQLYLRYHRVLLGLITSIVKEPMEAEDLLHDTYTKVWQRLDSYDPGRGSLVNWMLTIARHSALDSLRRHKGRPLTPYTELTILPISTHYWPLIETIAVEQLARSVLSPRYWQVVELAYWQGYTHQEIADRLALPLGTVKTRLRQAMGQLRPYFKEAQKTDVANGRRKTGGISSCHDPVVG